MESVVIRAVLMLALYSCNLTCCQNVKYLNTVVFDSVMLHGCHERGTITHWKFNDDLLFIDNTLVGKGSLESIQLLANKSVFIEGISLSHGGTYQCICGSSSVFSYYIEVEAPPRLIITANEQRNKENGSVIFLPQNENTFVFCFAIECRPEVNLTLMIDQAVTATSGLTVSRGSGFNETFSATVNVTKNVTRDIGNISCESNGLGTNSATRLNVLYFSYVPPIINLTASGYSDVSDNDTVWFPKGINVTITCEALNAKPTVDITWYVNDTPKEAWEHWTNSSTDGNDQTNSSYSILQHQAKSKAEIICRAGFEKGSESWNRTINTDVYDVVLKQIEISCNGTNITPSDETLYVAGDEKILVTCRAIITETMRRNDKLSWSVNNQLINISPFQEIYTFPFDRMVEDEQVNITCTVVWANVFEIDTERILIRRYDLPRISLLLNGKLDSNIVNPIKDEDVSTVNCTFTSSEIIANITWEFENVTIIEKVNSTLLFTPSHESGYVQCILIGPRGRQFSDTVFFTTSEKATEKHPIEVVGSKTIVFILITIIITITFVCGVSRLWKKLSAPRTTSVFANSSLDIRSTHLAMVSRDLPPIQTSSSELPNIDQHLQDDIIDTEKTCLSSDDINLDFQLTGEGNMRYWIATVTAMNSTIYGGKIIAKSVSENARMKEIMNFRALAKAVVLLPAHPNVADILGVTLDDVPYLIYQEYFEFGTLKDFLMRNYQQSSSGGASVEKLHDQDTSVQLTSFSVDICDGLLFLSKQSYRHPGLSARKVLLTSKGRCKLYDFWPADLAVDSMNQILEKKIPPIAWLAPETVFIGQYIEKSDVWSFGVVLWEIFALGETPFSGLTCAEIENKLRRKQYLERPMICAGGIFGAMLSMWNPNVEERPSFEKLHMTLHAFLNDMRDNFDVDAEPNYFSLNKDSSDDDDYIEHVI